jgi:hypothetical protein
VQKQKRLALKSSADFALVLSKFGNDSLIPFLRFDHLFVLSIHCFDVVEVSTLTNP